MDKVLLRVMLGATMLVPVSMPVVSYATNSAVVSSQSSVAKQSWDIPQTFKQTITWEGKMSLIPKIARSKSNPMRKVYNAWVKSGKKSGTKADGMNGIPYIKVDGKKRYLAAIASCHADTGDYVDVYLEDGSVLPLIMIDVQGCSDGRGYHNKKTCFMYKGVHYGHVSNQKGKQKACYVLEFMKTDKAPSGSPYRICKRLKPVKGSKSNSIKVTKIVNRGSYLKDSGKLK